MPFDLRELFVPHKSLPLSVAACFAGVVALLTGCSSPAPVPTVTVTVTTPGPTVTVTVTPTPTPTPTAEAAPPTSGGSFDLTTDEGLCAADAEMSNLELNDAIAPILGFPADRDARTFDQDEAIREYKNAAFLRACPARAS